MITCTYYFLAVLMVSILTGCAHTNSINPPGPDISKTAGMPANRVSDEYYLQIGDTVDIKFFYNPELNEQVSIRPDGKISLQLIDEVVTAGLTPSELDSLLTEQYSKILKHAEIAVIVKGFAGRNVYVGGEVNSPGMVPITGKLTSLQAILQAGGLKDTAEPENVVILRNQGTEEPLFMTINLKKDLTIPAEHGDILLEPYDIVYVPKTAVARLNQFVSQYINKLIPLSLTAGFSWIYNLNPETEIRQ